MSKLDIEKLTRLTKEVFFGGVSKLLSSMIVATHMQSWRSITSDPSILEMVAGYFSELDDMPLQPAVPHSIFSKCEELIIAVEIKKLLEKGVINEATHCAKEYISTVFTRPKSQILKHHNM